MAYTHTRTPEERGGPSPYLLRWSRSAAVVLVLFSTGTIAQGQTLTVRNPRDLLVAAPAAFMELLEASRSVPVSMEDMGAILRALPPEGEVTKLKAPAQQKVDAVRQLLTTTRRGWYEIKVIDLPQAVVALYARTVVLISEPALEVLNAAELQAMAAHEIGHEYVWLEWERARRDADQERLKELELVCDAIAAVTLQEIGMHSSILIDGLETIERFNRQRFGPARNEKSHPTLAERRAFARDIEQWLLRDSSRRFARGGSAATATSTHERPRLAVHIQNQADVRREDLAGARTEVERVFEAVGIEVAWVDAEEAGRITIRLLSITGDSREHSAGCALGLAHASRSTAYVFVNRIVRATRDRPVDLPVVLGRVVAHEIGHILAPGQHSSVGITRADLDFGYTNPGRFTDEEAHRIQSRLRANVNK